MIILEIIGVLFGLIYVVGAVFEKSWCWPAGIIGVSIYGISMYKAGIYGESMLQSLYILISIYGWRNWVNKINEKPEIITKTSFHEFLLVVFSSFVFTYLFWVLLTYFESNLPFWDAITNGFAIGATYLVARKKIENWILWIFIDITLSVILFLKGFYFYSGLYIVYTFIAIFGWKQWEKKISK